MKNQDKKKNGLWNSAFAKTSLVKALLLAFLSILPAFVLTNISILGGFNSIEKSIQDFRSSSRQKNPSDDIVLVTFTHRALERFGHWPIPREKFADALNIIASAEPKLVYMDFVIDIPREPAGDKALANAIGRFGKHKIAIPLSPASQFPKTDTNGESYLGALPILKDKVTLVESAIQYSSDGLVRSLRNQKNTGDENSRDVIEWLYDGSTYSSGLLNIDFSIQLKKIKNVNLVDLLDGRISPELFHNKRIIIGSNIHGVNQLVPVPVYNFLSRAEIFALSTETVLLGRNLTDAPPLLVFSLICFICIAITYLTLRLGATGGFLIAVIFAINLFSLANFAFTSHAVNIPIAFPMAAFLLSFCVGLLAVHPSFENFRLSMKGVAGRVDLRLAKVLEEGDDAIVTFSDDEKILSMNAAAERLIGKSASECIGKKLETVLPKRGSQLVAEAAMHIPGRVETVAQCRDGKLLPVDLTFNTVPCDDKWIGYVSLRDISMQQGRKEKLINTAYRDSLTGLANRACFYKELADMRAGSARNGSSAVFLLDLNNFKPVNEKLGHQAGDLILKEIGRRLTMATGSNATVARLGGDEFAIIQRGAPSIRGSERLAERIIEEIERPFDIADKCIRLETSIGIAHFPDHSRLPEELLKLADFAMYEAKRNGWGYSFADPILESDDLATAYVN